MIIDGHCDSLSVALDKNKSIDDTELSFNIRHSEQLNESIIQIMAAYVSPEKYVINGKKLAWERVNNIIDFFYKQNINTIQILKTKDIEKVEKRKCVGIMLSVENGSAICGDLNKIDELYDKGVRVMSITWNTDNELGTGANTLKDTGLTKLGKKYIEKLNNKKIIIDVSHTSKRTFYDVVNYTNKPIVATHSCVRELCNHKRNLDKNQIKQIAQSEGIIGICFYNEFLKTEKKVLTSEDIVDHICYIVDTVGIKYVGLGSDFDGVGKNELPKDVQGIKNIKNIKKEMKKRGFTNYECKMVMGDNWKRVINSII